MNTLRTGSTSRVGAGAAMLLLVCAASAPRPASAQLLPPPGSLIVNLTAPADGSTVSATTTVSASVTLVGALTVAGVQFRLDGANLGAEDRSAPYAVSWDTRTAANGSHTLTAVARDVLGLAFTSRPVTVTVSNEPPPAAGRHQETDPAIAYAGAWFEETTYPWTDGRALFAVNEGTATFTFTGTGVSWIGYRGHYGGIVRVFIDGAQVAEIDTYEPVDQVGVPVYTATGLAPGTHEIRIELTAMKNPAADASETAVDAFDVTP